ncbi:mercury methylation corrinoid protein HgcA [candidate division KSB1 bacterium]
MTGPSLKIKRTTAALTFFNHLDHLLARLAYKRNQHTVEQGLYSIGDPDKSSSVFVTANYTLSFDKLRQALKSIDGYIIVLDTKGINVWCAAGKGTFGTDELIRQIENTNLKEIIDHRTLIVPQLGAAGISAHEVKKRSGFKVEYGPIRADDLPEYLVKHKAYPAMRKVEFGILERASLIPVECINSIILFIISVLILSALSGFQGVVLTVAAFLTGLILFPLLFPYLPGKDFSVKGFILGFVIGLILLYIQLQNSDDQIYWLIILNAISSIMVFTALSGFLALNFTGSTPFTSKSGVKREIFRYIPKMAWTAGLGIAGFMYILVHRVFIG